MVVDLGHDVVAALHRNRNRTQVLDLDLLLDLLQNLRRRRCGAARPGGGIATVGAADGSEGRTFGRTQTSVSGQSVTSGLLLLGNPPLLDVVDEVLHPGSSCAACASSEMLILRRKGPLLHLLLQVFRISSQRAEPDVVDGPRS